MAREQARAWRPQVPGVTEVLHAHFTEHAYPAHVHGTWTILLVDTGGVDYSLDGRPHLAAPGSVTVLPPDVPHDGRAIHADGFDKRVAYLDETWFDAGLIGPAASAPLLGDDLVASVSALHAALEASDALEAESRLALVTEEISARLDLRRSPRPEHSARGVAREVRERLDASGSEAPTLVELAGELGVDPTHVIRAFRREYGIPPHQYLTGRRVDRARRLLLAGESAADVAVEVGFHDQSHLIRHFRRVLGVTPRAYLRSA